MGEWLGRSNFAIAIFDFLQGESFIGLRGENVVHTKCDDMPRELTGSKSSSYTHTHYRFLHASAHGYRQQ